MQGVGADGIDAIFYQKFWHIVGDDVAHTTVGIVHGTRPPDSVNSIDVALIPKTLTLIYEFRPSSLCNVIYKLFLKVMANRLKGILPSIVSENQGAFVTSRLFTNNALIASRFFILRSTGFEGRKRFIAMKLDMSETYDRVEWDFLRSFLLRLGFLEIWVNMIISCVSSSHILFCHKWFCLRVWFPLWGLR